MKRFLFVIQILVISTSLSAQKFEPVTVRAGRKVIDYFPVSERYRYPEFQTGRVQFKNGIYSESKLNFNFLMGEMEYIKLSDTLTLINKKDIKYISIAQDTFYYDKGYLELVSGGVVSVAMKQTIKLKEVLKKDSYGSSSSGSATNSYGSLPSNGNYYKLEANEDMIFQRTIEYYLSSPSGGFMQLTRKNVLQLFPEKEDIIKDYLKTNKIKLENRDDIIRLADYLSTL